MKFPTFAEYVAAQEGVFWASPAPRKGLSRINATPFTNAHRKSMVTKSKPAPNPFAPTVRPVAQVVPPHTIPKLKGGEWGLPSSFPFESPLGCRGGHLLRHRLDQAVPFA